LQKCQNWKSKTSPDQAKPVKKFRADQCHQ
jgi:hypothetical protein